MEIARVLLEAHGSNCWHRQREGGLVQADEQLSTAEVGPESSLDLQGKCQLRLLMCAKVHHVPNGGT